MKHLYTLMLCAFTSIVALAQQQTYSAQLVDESGLPIIGASIEAQGQSAFAITDADGRFSITVTPPAQLLVTYLGMQDLALIADASLPAKITMLADKNQLQEVVVTALGIERERQGLSSSVAQLEGRQLSDVPMPNIVNNLAGQVAGVQITNGSSGVGSSSRIVIRGENSLSSNNQPLIVVDGVPVSNRLITSALTNNGALQEVDFGNGLSEISPDDIASMSILKGAGSAALYGARAANGVVLLTTKKGQKQQGLGITMSNSLTVESLLTLPDYQNQYGGGSNGEYSFVNGLGAGVNDGGLASYGPPLDAGLEIAQFDSPSVGLNGQPVRGGDILARQRPDGSYTEITPTPWISRPNNVRNFFETGVTSQNNIAINHRSDHGGLRVAYNNLRNKGILPNTDLKRDGLALGFDRKLHDRLSIDGFVNYVNSRSSNRPNLGYGYENVMYGFNWTGRQANIEAMRDYWQAGQNGREHFDINYLWLTNPYLTLFENTNSFNKNRFFGNAAATLDLTDHLSLRVRTGVDRYDDDRSFRRAVSTNRNPFGSYREDQVRYSEVNSDVLVTYKNQTSNGLRYSLSGGANRFDQTISYQFAEASQLAIPGIYSLANTRNPLVGTSEIFTKRINSLYGVGNISVGTSLYLDVTVRNDWSSTLPLDNNSFAYYSAGASYILSEVVSLPASVSFLKVRLNASSAGNDTDPYQLNNTFPFNQNYGSAFRVTNESVLKNADLEPERLNALEAGLEAWFAGSRLQTELTVYQNTSINQIIGRPISTATGFSNAIENGGEVRTRGLEASVRGRLIETRDLSWSTTLNFTTYRSEVTRLPDGVEQYVTGEARIFGGGGGSNTVFYIAREGGQVGDMYGTGFVEIDGEILHGANGLPVQDGNLRRLGNYNPDFIMGLGNEIKYKHLTLSFLFDWRYGGTIVSRTKALGSTSGVLKETLAGREEGIVGEGVMNVGTPEDPSYVANTTRVAASRYYNNFFDRGNEASALYDASYIKLRQLALYYDMPQEWSRRLGLQDVKLGLIGNNLLLFTENPHFDPELNMIQERNFTYGVEDMSYPSTRSIGLSLKTSF